MLDKDKMIEQAAKAAEESFGNGKAPQSQAPVQPQPVPTGFSVGQGQNPDGSLSVVLVVFTPVGQAVYFVDPDSAKAVGESMVKAASASSTGLVVPK